MPTRDQLLALNDELRRLKAGGQRAVAVTDESLAQLRAAVAASGSEPVVSAVPRLAETASANYSPGSKSEPAPKIPAASAPVLPEPAEVKLPEGDKQTRWNFLRDLVLHDSVCRARVFPGKRVVFGVGNLDAAVMFVGEAPGGDEEDQGEPFVGRAGQLLNRMIKAMGLERGQAYIGNILNWRPEMPRNPDGSQTGNRPPTARELAYCLPFIRAQIAIIQPRVLVALGKLPWTDCSARIASRPWGRPAGPGTLTRANHCARAIILRTCCARRDSPRRRPGRSSGTPGRTCWP